MSGHAQAIRFALKLALSVLAVFFVLALSIRAWEEAGSGASFVVTTAGFLAIWLAWRKRPA